MKNALFLQLLFKQLVYPEMIVNLGGTCLSAEHTIASGCCTDRQAIYTSQLWDFPLYLPFRCTQQIDVALRQTNCTLYEQPEK